MVSVERVKEYSELEQEAPEVVEPRPRASWPERGQIMVDKLCIKYAEDLPLVLNSISLEIQAGEKIGMSPPMVMDLTALMTANRHCWGHRLWQGSFYIHWHARNERLKYVQSTLALSFFRFVEPSSGTIRIDNVDITKIGLRDLR